MVLNNIIKCNLVALTYYVSLFFRWLLQHRASREQAPPDLTQHEPLPGGGGRGDEAAAQIKGSRPS